MSGSRRYLALGVYTDTGQVITADGTTRSSALAHLLTEIAIADLHVTFILGTIDTHPETPGTERFQPSPGAGAGAGGTL